MVAAGDLLGCLGKREDLLGLVEYQDQGVRQLASHPRQHVRQQLRIAPQRLAERGVIGRRPEGLVEHRAKVQRLRLAVRRFVVQRRRRGVEQGLGQPADQVLGGLDDQHRAVGPAEEPVADALFLQIGDDPGAEKELLPVPLSPCRIKIRVSGRSSVAANRTTSASRPVNRARSFQS